MSADSIASINKENIKAFAETFLANPKHVEWLANSGNGTRFSRTLFLLVVLETLVAPSEGTIVFAVMLSYTIVTAFVVVAITNLCYTTYLLLLIIVC